MLLEDVAEEYDSLSSEDQKAKYDFRANESQYFDQLTHQYANKISRAGMCLDSSNALKAGEIYKPAQLLKNAEHAHKNRVALSAWTKDLPEMTSYVLKDSLKAYKTYLKDSIQGNDRSGIALMSSFAQKWEVINRKNMILDPEGLNLLVDIAKVIAAHRSRIKRGRERFILKPLLGWNMIEFTLKDDPLKEEKKMKKKFREKKPFVLTPLLGWQSIEGGLGDEYHNPDKVVVSYSEVELEAIFQKIAENFFKRLEKRRSKKYDEEVKRLYVEPIKLHLRAFMASMQYATVQFKNLVEGKLCESVLLHNSV